MTKSELTNLSPVLPRVIDLTREACVMQVETIIKELIALHALPKIDGKRPDQYLYSSFELLRQRCVALHWRMINLDINERKNTRLNRI